MRSMLEASDVLLLVGLRLVKSITPSPSHTSDVRLSTSANSSEAVPLSFICATCAVASGDFDDVVVGLVWSMPSSTATCAVVGDEARR